MPESRSLDVARHGPTARDRHADCVLVEARQAPWTFAETVDSFASRGRSTVDCPIVKTNYVKIAIILLLTSAPALPQKHFTPDGETGPNMAADLTAFATPGSANQSRQRQPSGYCLDLRYRRRLRCITDPTDRRQRSSLRSHTQTQDHCARCGRRPAHMALRFRYHRKGAESRCYLLG